MKNLNYSVFNNSFLMKSYQQIIQGQSDFSLQFQIKRIRRTKATNDRISKNDWNEN